MGNIETIKLKTKRESVEDFVGWISPDGNLEVIAIVEKSRHSKYKVICKICSKDKELFPMGYFISDKTSLKAGSKPCGCGYNPKWTTYQWKVRISRIVSKSNFNVIFDENQIITKNTKIECRCKIDNHCWKQTVGSLMSGRGCPRCAGNIKYTEQEALIKCANICQEMNYKVLGFPDGYKNVHSYFNYECMYHGVNTVKYMCFVNSGTRCRKCAKTGYNPNKSGSFYIVKWEKDGRSFIKFGITNRKVSTRIKQQANKTNYNYTIIFQEEWKDGRIPEHLENFVKKSKLFNVGIVNKSEFNDGFTETLSYEVLDELIKIILTELNKIGAYGVQTVAETVGKSEDMQKIGKSTLKLVNSAIEKYQKEIEGQTEKSVDKN